MNEEKLDRFARGDLTAVESRDLAQQALGDPELFDELTATALARTAISGRRRVSIAWLASAAAVVAILSATAYQLRPRSQVAQQKSAISRPPILLSRNSVSASPRFRGVEPGRAEARTAGLVTRVDDDAVTIDLGSLDGLEKGSQVDLLRDGRAIGKLTLMTIFRERARGMASPGITVHEKDAVRLPPPLITRAALDRIDALVAGGDLETARRVAEQAPNEMIDLGWQRPTDWNNLGAIFELHGDKVKARECYERALFEFPQLPVRESMEANVARVKGAR